MKSTVFEQIFRKIPIVGYFLVFLSISFFASAENEKEQINFDGQWNEGKRSVQFEYPVSATHDALYLYIENASQRSDITVRIMDSSNCMLEEELSAEIGIYCIPLCNLKNGIAYQLELTNQWGDRLIGKFVLD